MNIFSGMEIRVDIMGSLLNWTILVSFLKSGGFTVLNLLIVLFC